MGDANSFSKLLSPRTDCYSWWVGSVVVQMHPLDVKVDINVKTVTPFNIAPFQPICVVFAGALGFAQLGLDTFGALSCFDPTLADRSKEKSS